MFYFYAECPGTIVCHVLCMLSCNAVRSSPLSSAKQIKQGRFKSANLRCHTRTFVVNNFGFEWICWKVGLFRIDRAICNAPMRDVQRRVTVIAALNNT